MNILVTGSKGFVGKNLCTTLRNIRDGLDRSHPSLVIDNVYEYDVDSDVSLLESYCSSCDFVFNLAGVNRPVDNSEYMAGNYEFGSLLLDCLKRHGNRCPVMLSSSIQASLVGRYAGSEYGRSKLAGEELFFKYGEEFGVRVLVYRFANLFGKWCRPNYNSAVATFCYNIANDLEIVVNDRLTSLSLIYIDDLVDEMLNALSGLEHRCDYDGLDCVWNDGGKYCCVTCVYNVTLGRIADLLYSFREQSSSLIMPSLSGFEKALYSTYLSYLPVSKICFDLKMNVDSRGSFTEVLKTLSCGQFSVNVSNPGVTKGEHWHHSKWEFFIVVSGHGLIRERNIFSDEVIEFEVDGSRLQCVHMLPGYTHSIVNLSDSEPLVTLMWANELFDSNRPDTYRELV